MTTFEIVGNNFQNAYKGYHHNIEKGLYRNRITLIHTWTKSNRGSAREHTVIHIYIHKEWQTGGRRNIVEVASRLIIIRYALSNFAHNLCCPKGVLTISIGAPIRRCTLTVHCCAYLMLLWRLTVLTSSPKVTLATHNENPVKPLER